MPNLSIAIVGFPNVGKSTLFNALLKQQTALAANYPFATIEPNVGIAEVPDDRLPELAAVVGTNVIKPATVEFIDIAGLVKGASQGEGLGNKFLAHIRETAAICHVLRAFSDSSILREGTSNPKDDLEAIRLELQLADLATLEKQPQPKGIKDPAAQEQWTAIQTALALLQEQKMLNQHLTPSQQKSLADLNLLTVKPEIMVINSDETALADYDEVQHKYATELNLEPHQVIIISAQIESELSGLLEEEQLQYLQDLGVKHSGLERLAKTAYATLKLQSFLTAGEKEVRAWTIRQGTAAPQAAAVIHTDFEKHFIKANVANYHDFIQLKGWKGVREHGKLRLEGRDYILQPDDVVEFMIGN